MLWASEWLIHGMKFTFSRQFWCFCYQHVATLDLMQLRHDACETYATRMSALKPPLYSDT
jgi:hypothetical protein